MSPKIAIVDYSIGNLFSVFQACAREGMSPFFAKNHNDLMSADGVILPGVGAFGQGMNALRQNGLDESIHEFIKSGKPFMGVCLGMQLLLDSSEEFGESRGLGIFRGKVRHLNKLDALELTVPKITWDTITPGSTGWDNSPLKHIPKQNDFYFVHSYYCECENEKDILAYSQHGQSSYAACLLKDNIFATQFHPEKSGELGLKIYRDWKELNFR